MRGLRGSGFLIVAAFAVIAAVYSSIPLLLGTDLLGRVLSSVLYMAVPTVAVVGLLRAVRRTSGVERRSWVYLTAGVSVIALADLVWIAVLIASPAGMGSNPLSYALYALALGPVLMHVSLAVSTSLAGTPVLSRVRYSLDISIAVLLACVTLVVFFLLPQYRTLGALDRQTWAVDSSIVLLGAVVLVLFVGRIIESAEPIWRRWEGKIALATGLFVGAEFALALVWPSGSAPFGTPSGVIGDIVWLAGYALLGAAGFERTLAPPETVGMPPMSHARRSGLRWYDIAVASTLIVAVPYVLVESRYGTLGDAQFWILGTGTFVIAALVIARSAVLTSENGNLLVHTVVDPLTGAYNHRYFHERVAAELERSRRSGTPLSVLLLDLDEFGRVNEDLGHQRGDQCLKRVAELLRLQERSTDTLCRMGGDEFAIIMPGIDARGALGRARLLQTLICEDLHIGECVHTISAGIASAPVHANDRTSLVQKAQGALYWAQATGVGQAVVYDDQVVEALTAEERLQLAEEQSYMHAVESLAAAVDARDPYTQNHSRNVAALSARLARHLGMSENHVNLVRIGGLLHDVGKIGVPDSILRKPGFLTSEERVVIEGHPELGQRILSATIFKEILPWVLHHHERWDGNGYPHHLEAEQIPYESRLLAVCDAFDAMVSDRPYRSGMPTNEALHEIELHAGSQFDPLIASAFVEMMGASATADDADLRSVSTR